MQLPLQHDQQAWQNRRQRLPLWRRVLSRVSRGGLWQTASYTFYCWREKQWEKSLGVETAQCIPWQSLGSDKDREDYMPTDFQLFQRAISRVSISRESAFLDYGSGKGRNLILAAQHPFGRVYGIEYVERLCEASRHNVARARGRKQCRDVRVAQGDAASWPCPDDVTVIFLFNPFTGPILKGALDRIAESLQRQPRQITVFYLQPVRDENRLHERPWLKHRADLSTWPRQDVRLIEYVTEAEKLPALSCSSDQFMTA